MCLVTYLKTSLNFFFVFFLNLKDEFLVLKSNAPIFKKLKISNRKTENGWVTKISLNN